MAERLMARLLGWKAEFSTVDVARAERQFLNGHPAYGYTVKKDPLLRPG